MSWLTGCPARMHRAGATRRTGITGASEVSLHSLPSLPTEARRNGQYQAPALPNDAERLSAIIATQQEIATAGLDLGTVLTLIADRTQALTGASGAAVELAEGSALVYRGASGTAADPLGLRLQVDTSVSGRCVRTGQALRCDDAEADDRVDRQACRKVGLRPMIVVPLLYDRRAVGVLKVLSHQPGAFSDRDVQTLQLMAGLIAAALNHAAAYEAKRALVEERTGALRQSEERLRLLWESAAVLLTTEQPDAMLRGLFTKDAVITTDVEGRVTYLNPVAETLTGWTTAEARGLPL